MSAIERPPGCSIRLSQSSRTAYSKANRNRLRRAEAEHVVAFGFGKRKIREPGSLGAGLVGSGKARRRRESDFRYSEFRRELNSRHKMKGSWALNGCPSWAPGATLKPALNLTIRLIVSVLSRRNAFQWYYRSRSPILSEYDAARLSLKLHSHDPTRS